MRFPVQFNVKYCVSVHPDASVIVTSYKPDERLLIDEPVLPFDHK